MPTCTGFTKARSPLCRRSRRIDPKNGDGDDSSLGGNLQSRSALLYVVAGAVAMVGAVLIVRVAFWKAGPNESVPAGGPVAKIRGDFRAEWGVTYASGSKWAMRFPPTLWSLALGMQRWLSAAARLSCLKPGQGSRRWMRTAGSFMPDGLRFGSGARCRIRDRDGQGTLGGQGHGFGVDAAEDGARVPGI